MMTGVSNSTCSVFISPFGPIFSLRYVTRFFVNSMTQLLDMMVGITESSTFSKIFMWNSFSRNSLIFCLSQKK